MPYAACLNNPKRGKKKAKFIIPASYYRGESLSKPIAEVQPKVENSAVETVKVPETEAKPENVKFVPDTQKVSPFSLKSIQAKKELESKQQSSLNLTKELPKEPFTQEQMLSYWNEYAQRLNSSKKLMFSYMTHKLPVLEGTAIKVELTSSSSKTDFLEQSYELLSYLKDKLRNYDITIAIDVKEDARTQFIVSPQEKYDYLKNINPHLDLLRNLLDLDI